MVLEKMLCYNSVIENSDYEQKGENYEVKKC